MSAPVPAIFPWSRTSPTPSTHSTVIRYHLATPSQLRLDVFDLAGQKVRSFLHAQQPAGYYQLSWDGRNDLGWELATGIYFVKLQAGANTEVSKLILLK